MNYELRSVMVVDSHTEGEPTRVVLAGGPDLGSGDLRDRANVLVTKFDAFRSGVICEPRGSEVVVGALLCAPLDPTCATGVIFFNDVGLLGMCGHGTIGLVTTLAHLGRIAAGHHRIETRVGVVSAELHEDGRVSVANVPSYRYRAEVSVDVPRYGQLVGDIAWAGNWFFLMETHQVEVVISNRNELIAMSTATRSALMQQGITGKDGETIDHIEISAPSRTSQVSSRNFVLCPGASFDRSPCGTGTSAKLACLYADGKLKPGEVWVQEGILGTKFEGVIAGASDGRIHPVITGRAWITAETTLRFDPEDPFAGGITFS